MKLAFTACRCVMNKGNEQKPVPFERTVSGKRLERFSFTLAALKDMINTALKS
jgi:hypothetical protein